MLFRYLSLSSLIWLLLICNATTVAAAEEETIVYFSVSGPYADSATELRNVFVRGIDELKKFRAVKTTKGYIGGTRSLGERLSAADKAEIPWLADVLLESDKKKSVVSLRIYRTSGENAFNYKEEFDAGNVRALLAQLEYELPKQLKTRFLELGRVIKIEDRFAYFDLGATADVKVGEIYQAFRENEDIEDSDGNSFGSLETITGVVRVVNVNSIYSMAEILNGEFTIEPGQMVRKGNLVGKSDKFQGGEILSVLNDRVAINIGKDVGVKNGSYYAIYRDIKDIATDSAFKQTIGHIKITEVNDDYAKGVVSISDHFDLTKNIIVKGDKIVETESPRKNGWSVHQLITNVAGSDHSQMYVASYQRDASKNIALVYRFRGGYSSGEMFFAGGVMHSLSHSEHFYMGADINYVEEAPSVNLFLSTDVDTPLSKNLKFNVETGYNLAHQKDKYNGINLSLGVKYGLDIF